MATLAENSIEAAPRRVVGRPFQKGQSGNPGGRPKGLARYVRELVGDDGRAIADFVFGVLADENQPIETRMKAAVFLADRGFGRPVAPEPSLSWSAASELGELTSEELDALAAEALRALRPAT